MLLISNNIIRYMKIPDESVIRINLAWHSYEKLIENLKLFNNNEIFLDWPVRRIKPPKNHHDLSEIKNLIENFKNIKYMGISNVENPYDLELFLKLKLKIIPKIESIMGIKNIKKILQKLPYKNKIIMLDHEDLYNDLMKNNISPSELYPNYIEKLNKICKDNNVKMLKTIGIIFND